MKAGKVKISKSQINERSRFAKLMTEWSRMSYEKKLEWHEQAKEDSVKRSGKGKKIVDGHSLFMSFNGYLQIIGESINIDVPKNKFTPILFAQNLEVKNEGKASYIRFYFREEINEEMKVIVYATKGLNLSTPRYNVRDLRMIGVIDEKFKSGDSLLAQYLRQYKSLPDKGKVIGFKVTPINKYSGKKGLSYIFTIPVK